MTNRATKDQLDFIVSAMEAFVGKIAPGVDPAKVSELWRLAMDFADGIDRLLPEGERKEAALVTVTEAVRICTEGIVQNWEPEVADGS